MRYLLILMITIVTAAGCNRQGARIDRMLDHAEALMQDHPDSALAIIQSIDTTGLSRFRIARHTLLKIEALDKNDNELPDEAFLKIPLEFYKGTNSNEEATALYYYGKALYNKGEYGSALPTIHLSHDLCKKLQNYRYEGLNAKYLARLYKMEQKLDKALEYVLDAQQAHRKYDSVCNRTIMQYSTWLDIMLAEAYNDLRQPEKALDISNVPDTSWYNNDEFFRLRTLRNKATSYFILNRTKDVIQQFATLQNNGYDMQGIDWCVLSNTYLQAGDISMAKIYMDSAHHHIDQPEVIPYLKLLNSRYISETGDYEKAYHALKEWNNALRNSSDSILLSTVVLNAIDLYQAEAQKQQLLKSIHKEKNNYLTIIIILIATILILTFIIFRNKIKSKTQKIDKLEKEKSELNDAINNALLEIRRKEEELNRSNESIDSQHLELRTFIANKIEHLSKAYVHMLKYKNLQDKSIKSAVDIESVFTYIDRTDSLSSLDQLIDIANKEWLEKTEKIRPYLSSNQFRLARYLYNGFSNEMIIAILNIPNSNAFRVEKSRLKTSIIKSGIDNLEEILHKMNMISSPKKSYSINK